MKRLATIVRFALFAILLAAGPVAAQLNLTTGKYSAYQLWSQFTECHDEQCPGCMSHWFPDPGNPFDARNTENCEGIYPWLNWFYYYGSKLFDSDWIYFAVFTQIQTLNQTIIQCQQRYGVDVQCHIEAGDVGYDVRGAYLAGSGLFLNSLDEYIDRPPSGGGGRADERVLYDWAPLREWVEFAVNDYQLAAWLPLEMRWGVVFYASLLYWAELSTGGPAARAERYLEEELALKTMAHSLVCWQSADWENGREIVDLLEPNGIADWPFRPDETPAFVYTLWYHLRDLVGMDVGVAGTSWSALKGMYR